jgi:hypothetical protein
MIFWVYQDEHRAGCEFCSGKVCADACRVPFVVCPDCTSTALHASSASLRPSVAHTAHHFRRLGFQRKKRNKPHSHCLSKVWQFGRCWVLFMECPCKRARVCTTLESYRRLLSKSQATCATPFGKSPSCFSGLGSGVEYSPTTDACAKALASAYNVTAEPILKARLAIDRLQDACTAATTEVCMPPGARNA